MDDHHYEYVSNTFSKIEVWKRSEGSSEISVEFAGVELERKIELQRRIKLGRETKLRRGHLT